MPSRRQREKEIELRSPDPSANPYLVFALCLAAGIDGIERNLEIPEELTKSIRSMSEEEKNSQGIDSLPENLSDALYELEKDVWLKEILGTAFFEHYKKAKKKEWKSYMKQVSDWELEQYLYQI